MGDDDGPSPSPSPSPVRLGYLDGALHDERRELGHHQVHALKAGLFQFEDLLFDNGLKGQVGGEEPRPGDIQGGGGVGGGRACFGCSGRETETETEGGNEDSEEEKRKRQGKEVVLQLVLAVKEKRQPDDEPQVFTSSFLSSQFLYSQLE